MTDGIVVSEGRHSSESSIFEWVCIKKRKSAVLPGSVCRLRLYLRRSRTYITAPQDSGLPGQYILGSNNGGTPALHSSLIPFPACETAHVQPGESCLCHRVTQIWSDEKLTLFPVFLQAAAIVTVLMLLIFYKSTVFLFVGTCLCGLFLSTIFPCMLAYAEDILDYRGIVATVKYLTAFKL